MQQVKSRAAERRAEGAALDRGFILELGEALRETDDPAALVGAACARIGLRLRVECVAWAELDAAGAPGLVDPCWTDPDAPADLCAGALAAFRDALDAGRRRGATIVAGEPAPPGATAAFVFAPIARGGRAAAGLLVGCSGPRRWSAATLKGLEDVAGRLWASLARCRAEIALRESEARLRRASEAAGFGVYEFDPLRRRIVTSEGLRRVLGVDVGEGGFADVEALGVHPDDRARVRALVEGLRRRVGPYAYEFRIVRPDGDLRWIVDRGETTGPLDPASGLAARVLGAVSDITDRKRAEHALRDRAEELEQLLSESPVGVSLSRDPECREVWANPALRRLLRLAPGANASLHPSNAEAPGVLVRRNGEPIGLDALPMQRACASGLPVLGEEIELVFPDGGAVWLHVTAQPLFDAEGRARGCISFAIDMTERRRAVAELARRHEELNRVYDSANVGLCVIGRDLRYRRINARLAEMNGLPAAEHVGRTVREVIPGVADDIERLVARILRTREGVTELELSGTTPARPGETRCWIEHWLPILDDAGEVDAVNVVVEDVTDRRRAEAALRLRESEARARAAEIEAIYDAAPIGIGHFDRDWRVVRVNARLAALGGRPAAEFIGRPAADVLPPAAVEALAAMTPRLLAGEEVAGPEVAAPDPATGETLSHIVACRPLSGEADAVDGFLVTMIDISERKRAEAALRRSHDTWLSLIDNHAFGVCLIDADFRLARLSAGARRAFGDAPARVGRDFAAAMRALWPRGRAVEIIDRFRRTLATGEPFQAVAAVRRRDGAAEETYDWRIERVVLPDGRFGLVCFFYDLTERKRFEDQIRLLNQEVNHRSKNMLSVVLAVARQTAASTAEEFLPRFERRIAALAANQDLLVRNAWRRVSVEELVLAQLDHFRDLIGRRVFLRGPPLALVAAAAQTLGMAIHELATNASKYGSLSGDAGRVDIEWDLARGPEGPRFAVSWTESGGPPVEPEPRHGFGRAVVGALADAAHGADVALEFRAEGVRWRFACPADRAIAPREPGEAAPAVA